MRSALVIVIGVFVLAASGLLRGDAVAQRPAAQPSKVYGLEKPPFAHVPSTSCASASCHGGRADRRGGEYTAWAPDLSAGPTDPHSKAHRVLFTTESARMAKSLGDVPAHKHSLCLKCHAADDARPEAANEGVGCGACHGPAEKWLTAHIQPGWKALSHVEKWERYGFSPAGNLVARATNCVGCHVGDGDRDVTHDLIALGHPRLNFEYTRWHFNPNYRRHWTEKTPQPDFEVRAWVVGQATTLRAATELLRVRAERAAANDPKAVWPEFAGLSCYACHQKIDSGQPGGDANPKRPVGVAGWEVWSHAASGVAAELCPTAFPGIAAPKLGELDELRKSMAKPNANPKAVAERAKKAVAELDAWLAELQVAEDRAATRVAPDAPRAFARALAANALSTDRTQLADHDWDALAANYLGCAAMYHARGGQAGEPRWTEPVRGASIELRFPAAKPGERFDSPAGFGHFDRNRVRVAFRVLFDATAGGER